MSVEMPFWEKYTLTIREAAEYFHIGEKKMRRIAEENINSDFVIMNGNRVMIKRKSFEQYIDQATAV
ncbi:MAG: helix-turn-helix domain-containing protein [Clostridiales bacterium]|nr:helix-turn-helix domain-containing protein [Clostridiales bacterium]